MLSRVLSKVLALRTGCLALMYGGIAGLIKGLPFQLPQPLQSQRLPQPPQHAVHYGARPLQPHTSKPLQHQVLTPPQNVGHPQYQQPQHLPPQQLAPIRPAPESHNYQKPPWSPYSHPVQTRVNQPQHPSPYHGYSPTGVRSPVTHSQTPSPTGTHPRPSQLDLESHFMWAADMANCIPFEDPLVEGLERAALKTCRVG